MVRWGLLALGLYLIFFSEPASEVPPGPAPEGPAPVAAEDVLESEDGSLVTLEAELDLARRAYPLDLARPAFAPCPPRGAPRLVEPAASPRDLDPLIGCPVEARVRLAPDVLVLEGPRAGGGETRLLGPLVGRERTLWVISPPAGDAAAARRARWMHSEVFTGRLTRLEDIGENLPALGTSGSIIAATFLEEFGEEIPEKALLILSEPTPEEAPAPRRPGAFYAPVRGSGNALLVRVTPGVEGGGGRVTGRLLVRRGDELPGLERALGGPIPPRVALLEPASGEDERTASGASPWRGRRLAYAFLGASGFLFLRRYLWIRREKKVVAREVEARLAGPVD